MVLWAADCERSFAMRGMNRNLTIAFVLLVSLGHPVTTFAVDFSSPKSYPVGTSPAAVAVGDFNGDGKLDIAVANSGSGNVGILLGNGDGTFQAAVNFDAGMASPRSVAMGDFNHDGKMDLAVFQPSLPTDSGTLAPGALSILLGNGDGSFQAAETQALSSTAAGMAVADFNLDGKSDLAVSDSDPNTNILSINIFLGKGDGTFQPGKQTSLPSGSNTSFTAADLNRDSKPDLAVGSSSGFVILLGKGDGTFQAGPATAVADGFVVQNVQAEDVNGDGSVDLVVESFHFQGPPPGQNEGATSRADHISFFLGNGNGTFQGEQIIATSRWRKATVFSPPVGDSIESLILGDYNGDGKLDLAYPRTRFFADRTRRTSLEIRLGKGDGTFSPIVALPGPGIILAAADLNSDKLSDLVVTGSGSDIGVVLNASPTSGADLGLVAAGASNDPAGVGTNLTY